MNRSFFANFFKLYYSKLRWQIKDNAQCFNDCHVVYPYHCLYIICIFKTNYFYCRKLFLPFEIRNSLMIRNQLIMHLTDFSPISNRITFLFRYTLLHFSFCAFQSWSFKYDLFIFQEMYTAHKEGSRWLHRVQLDKYSWWIHPYWTRIFLLIVRCSWVWILCYWYYQQ